MFAHRCPDDREVLISECNVTWRLWYIHKKYRLSKYPTSKYPNCPFNLLIRQKQLTFVSASELWEFHCQTIQVTDLGNCDGHFHYVIAFYRLNEIGQLNNQATASCLLCLYRIVLNLQRQDFDSSASLCGCNHHCFELNANASMLMQMSGLG